MRLYPITVGRRIFLYHEWIWCGWKMWAIGFNLGYEPELYLGPFLLRMYED